MATAAIDVRGLRKCFGAKVALANFSLRLERGKIFGAVGANGGGKTTALRILAGLLPPDSGGGRILELDLANHRAELRRQVGYMTQHYSLYRDFTVTENLLARARIYGVADPCARVVQLMDEYGLAASAGERVGRLSGGWMRRVQFVAALVPAPPVLLLDEPTAGLDLETSQQLWASMVRLAARGTTIVISTHDLGEANRCDEVGVFVEGRVVASGTVEDAIRQSAVQVVRISAQGVDPEALRAALPELVSMRPGARHHDLFLDRPPGPESLAWMRAQNFLLQPVDPTLEAAIAVLVSRRQLAHEPV